MHFIKNLHLSYFKPKSFECFRTKTIYDFIGIKAYKKYLPTTGDLMRRWRKIKQIDLTQSDKISQLYQYEKQTRTYEWRHIIGAVLFILFTSMLERELTIYDWILLPILNLYINIYPIFLQRYNRIRILKVLKGLDLKVHMNNANKNPFMFFV